MSGTLFICGTPIGNLEDITIRCLNTLKSVDVIAAEDTRQTIKLLNHYEIKTPLTSYHEHNKAVKGHKLLEEIKKGKNIALVSDAGMPGISDPGEDLIKLCYEENISVTAVPGPTAEATAAVLSGIGCTSYCFEGFLPKDKKQRKAVLDRLKNETRTIVIYEAPHRIKKTLDELYKLLGNRNAAVVKELTKKHENIFRGSIENIIDFYEKNEPKGEFVLVIEGIGINQIRENEKAYFQNISIKEHIELYLNQGMSNKEAMKQTAKDRGVGKREIYDCFNRPV